MVVKGIHFSYDSGYLYTGTPDTTYDILKNKESISTFLFLKNIFIFF
jgi:hypothetical protein